LLEQSRVFALDVKRNPLREYSPGQSVDRQALLTNLAFNRNRTQKEVSRTMVIKKTDPICLVSMVVKQG
jgi:hypothetical protein